MPVEELGSDAWRVAGATVYKQILSKSRLDPTQTSELIVVPDDVLWYLPIEALPPGPADGDLIMDRTLVRYAPFASLAVRGHEISARRVQRTGLVVDEIAAAVETTEIDSLAGAVTGPFRLEGQLTEPAPLVAALMDQLIVFDSRQLELDAPFDWQLLPRSRSRSGGRVDELLSIPFGGPQKLVLAHAATEAENGLKGLRKSTAKGIPPGHELFLATSSFMARGVQTMLVSRWRTGGRANLQLVREFVQELPFVPAAASWQRSVFLARDTPLDPPHEPRIKQSDDVRHVHTAEHPFFWAGYLLADIGQPITAEEPKKPAASNQEENKSKQSPNSTSAPPSSGERQEDANRESQS
jgi:hypothetical protein